MLNVTDLINIQHIPEISDVSLELYVDFYEQYLCKRIFVFTLSDGQCVKLFFKDTSEIFHLSGIDHIYEGIHMDGTRFVDGIKKKVIDFASLEGINKAAYTDYIDRIRSFACIDTIIKNCEYLCFPGGNIPSSTIKVKYLLLKGLDNKNLHLGISTYKEGRTYFSKTLLVTAGYGASKYIDKAEKRLRVDSLEIIDKNTNVVLEKIERTKAIEKANCLILELASTWFEQIFPGLIEEYNVNYKLMRPNSRKKKEWISKLNRYLESEQDNIRIKVRTYDSYWTSKIVAEQIRFFVKREALSLLNKVLEE